MKYEVMKAMLEAIVDELKAMEAEGEELMTIANKKADAMKDAERRREVYAQRARFAGLKFEVARDMGRQDEADEWEAKAETAELRWEGERKRAMRKRAEYEAAMWNLNEFCAKRFEKLEQKDHLTIELNRLK